MIQYNNHFPFTLSQKAFRVSFATLLIPEGEWLDNFIQIQLQCLSGLFTKKNDKQKPNISFDFKVLNQPLKANLYPPIRR